MIIWWLTTLAWVAEILYLSTPTFKGSLSESLLVQIVDSLYLSVSWGTLEVLDSLLRKIAHLTEYGIFALLLYRCFAGRDGFRWRPHLAYWCVVAACAYSLTDELHQVFSPGRHASLIDSGIDTTGAAMAMLLVYGSSWVSAAIRNKRLRTVGLPAGM
jgi:VanZ family protein